MSEYRKIELRMWGDDKFRSLSRLPASGQSLWLVLLCGEHTTALPGLLTVGRLGLSESLGWELEELDAAWEEVCGAGMAEADWDARLIWLPRALDYNPPHNTNVAGSWGRRFGMLPECELRERALGEFIRHMCELERDGGKPYLRMFMESFSNHSINHSGIIQESSGESFANRSCYCSCYCSCYISCPYSLRSQGQEEQDSKRVTRGQRKLQGNGREVTKESSVEEESTVSPNELLALYNEKCPSFVTAKKLTETRRVLAKRRLKEHPELSWWESFFERAEASDFLAGRVPRSDEHANWSPDFEWLLKPSNMTKVDEGRFDNRGNRAGKVDPTVAAALRLMGGGEEHKS